MPELDYREVALDWSGQGELPGGGTTSAEPWWPGVICRFTTGRKERKTCCSNSSPEEGAQFLLQPRREHRHELLQTTA